MDWHSRYVLSWRLSNSLDVPCCLEALEGALTTATPEMVNTDQGSPFTRVDFTGCLKAHAIRISRDGRGRVFDNIFIERLWRSVKYEEIYLKDYGSVAECKQGLHSYFRFYNEERFHQSLQNQTPHQVYWSERRQAA